MCHQSPGVMVIGGLSSTLSSHLNKTFVFPSDMVTICLNAPQEIFPVSTNQHQS